MKKIREIQMIFDIEHSLPIFALCAELAKLGKASQDAYNPRGWLILQALLKNGVTEGVTSNPHDTKYLPYLTHNVGVECSYIVYLAKMESIHEITNFAQN